MDAVGVDAPDDVGEDTPNVASRPSLAIACADKLLVTDELGVGPDPSSITAARP